MDGLERLRGMEYPGRFIVLGANQNGAEVAVYGITGRSDSSKARKMVVGMDSEDRAIKVEPTDSNLVRQGNHDLLLYNAAILREDNILVGNGKQVRVAGLLAFNAIEAIARLHMSWGYEHDSPNWTPRISGVVKPAQGEIALGSITRGRNGSIGKAFFGEPIQYGSGRFISTYSGENTHPLPSFRGEPLEVSLAQRTAEETARFFYDLLDERYRVSVAAIVSSKNKTSEPDIHIVNRVDG